MAPNRSGTGTTLLAITAGLLVVWGLYMVSNADTLRSATGGASRPIARPLTFDGSARDVAAIGSGPDGRDDPRVKALEIELQATRASLHAANEATKRATATTSKGTDASADGSYVRKRFNFREIKTLLERVVPHQQMWPSSVGGEIDDRESEHPKRAYFEKYADLDANVERVKAATGKDIKQLAAFPGRLFNLLDMLEWNASYGFLNCKRHLSLFATDAEHQFKSKECIDSTELWMYNNNEKSNDGDLHYPVTLPGAGKYDLVTFSQTLEHIYDPVLALKNLFDALAPGGYLMTSVPNLNHGHMLPIYFSMPTPWGLAVWCKMAGFEPLHTGQFGNRQYVYNLVDEPTWWPKWPRYYNKTRRPQIINDPFAPADVWVLARKPLAPGADDNAPQ